jgi:hypothetical protein
MSFTAPPQGARSDASPAIVSWDRQAVRADGVVVCPLRDHPVPLELCLECGLLVRRDRSEPLRFIVCYARVMTGWLGFDNI